MATKYSCVSLVSKGDRLTDYSYIEVDKETGFWKWKKKERIKLATYNGIDFVNPNTGAYVYDGLEGLRNTVRLYNMSNDKSERIGL